MTEINAQSLKALQLARGRTVNKFQRATGWGPAHHQVEVFAFDAATGEHRGRLCTFKDCPKGKMECLVPGCGDIPHLAVIDGFTYRPEALAPEKCVVLFEREE